MENKLRARWVEVGGFPNTAVVEVGEDKPGARYNRVVETTDTPVTSVMEASAARELAAEINRNGQLGDSGNFRLGRP